MTVEILTTQFIAKPEDLDRAYALYEKRIAQAEAKILAYSPKPLPSDDEFELWSLRTQAVYDQLDSPLQWHLYELNALVEFDEEKVDDDELREKFFFEDIREPTAFPGTLIGSFAMNLRRKPRTKSEIAAGQEDVKPLTYVTVAFFAAPEKAGIIPELFSDFVEETDPIVHGGAPTEADVAEKPNYAGPLWMQAAQSELDMTGDRIPYGSKRLWLGCILIDYDAEKLREHLPESLDPNNFVLAELYPEPF